MNAGNYQEFMAESDAILRQLEKTGIPVSVEKTRDYAYQLEIILTGQTPQSARVPESQRA